MPVNFPRWLSNPFAVALLAVGLAGMSARPSPSSAAEPHQLSVRKLGDPGPLEIVDGDTPVLRYNYQVVAEPEEVKGRISEGNRKYAVPRADYIHPLYGPRGEVLTEDWSPDHPHHRGIYWAWPEVDWQGQRGDLHALQLVFAKPTGQAEIQQGPDFVQISAASEWRWDDRTPVVREQATIRAYVKSAGGRAIDLQFQFTALDADVLLARRGTSHYGGLNVRLSAAPDQLIETLTDPAGVSPRRAWAQRTGTPAGGQGVVGLTILQHARNPDFPGDWVQYPNLSWIQPTFPAADTRYTLAKERPLVLRYRFVIHEGKQAPETIGRWWDAYHATSP